MNVFCFGAGKAGGNVVEQLLRYERQLKTDFIVGAAACDTTAADLDALTLIPEDARVLFGAAETNGDGFEGDAARGAEAAKREHRQLLEPTDTAPIATSDAFVVCAGLGGGTGTGSAPVVAQAAQDQGALTISIVTIPFTAEGERRRANADAGLERLRAVSDTVIVVPNDRLLDYAPSMPLQDAFKICDRVLMRSVKGMTELITKPGLVNVDFADVRTIMENGGVAMIGLGESDSENKAQDSIRSALRSPLLDVEFDGANSALVNVVGGPDMSIEEAEGVVEEIYDRIDPDARIIWGASVNQEFEGKMETMIVVTGVESPQIYGKSEAEAERASKELGDDIDYVE